MALSTKVFGICVALVGNAIAVQPGNCVALVQTGSKLGRGKTAPRVNQTVDQTLTRMQYFTTSTAALPTSGKYLFFSPDHGGPNNIRIGWEFAGVMALETGRTFVLPPASSLYLLDEGAMHNWTPEHPTTTAVQDLINLNQLKGSLPTLTWEEFQQQEDIDTWSDLVAKADHIANQEENNCKFEAYQEVQSKFLYMDGAKREGFNCGEWWLRGGPRDETRQEFTEKDWSLLTHGFVWHKDAFDIAAAAVNYLGIFNYSALHARYNDFVEKQTQNTPGNILSLWGELFNTAPTLYIASDEPEKFREVKSKATDYDIVTFDDLFNARDAPLRATKNKYTKERWFKMIGLAEELICTYAKSFVGTGRSSFTGHIQRMRLHAQAPVTEFLYHNGKEADGETEAKIAVPMEAISQELNNWHSKAAIVRGSPTQGDQFLELAGKQAVKREHAEH